MDSEDEEPPADADAGAAPEHRPAPELTGSSPEVLASAKEKMDRGIKKITAANAVKNSGAPSPLPDEVCGLGPPEDNPKLASFFVKEPGTSGLAIFVPDGRRLVAVDLTELCEKAWKMKGPNVMISCDAGTVHPKRFAAMPLVKTTKSFEGFWRDATQHAERALHPDKTGKPAPTDDERDVFGLAVINDVLFLKLVTVFCSILDASTISDNWILIDRTGSKSPAADVLIEAAMMSTTSRPQTVVIDSFKRLKIFRGKPGGEGGLYDEGDVLHPKTQECINKLKEIRAGGVPFGTDQEPATAVISQFYEPVDFMDPDRYNEVPLPRPPEREHLKGRDDGKPPERVRWQYSYLQTFFGAGTHYIVLDNPSDAPDLSGLGKIGYVVANGQGLMAPRLKMRIQAGESIVMLHNTGGVVQAWASLRKAILSKFPAPESSELMEKLELKSTADWIKDFGLAEIMMLQELHQRAPMLLRTSCVAVDVMRDTSEDALSTLTCCFSGGGGVPELGLGEAEQLCVLTCWKRHMILRENADKFEKIADNIQVFLYMLGILSTALAVFYSQENQSRDQAAALAALPTVDNILAAEQTNGGLAATGPDLTQAAEAGSGPAIDLTQETPLGYIMILAPIVATLVGTVRTKMRPREKWATCLMASNQIVDQIYRYRLRTDPYDTSKNPPVKEGEEPVEVPVKMREMNARKAFIDCCSEIYSNAIATEVAKNGALKMGVAAKLNTSTKPADRKRFQLILKEHVEGNLYGKRVPKLSAGVGGAEGEVKAAAKDLMKQGKDAKGQLADAKKKKGMLLKLVSKTPLAKMPAFKKALSQINEMESKLDSAMSKVTNGVESVMDKVNDAVDSGKEAVVDAAAKAGVNLDGKIDGKEEEKEEEEADDLGAKKGGGKDDYISQISIEAYVDARLRQYTGYLERRAPLMARRGLILEHIAMLANTAGAVMAVINLTAYVAISVAIASVAMAFLDYWYIPSQLAATSKALEDAHNILLFWDSLSLVQRKMGSVKLKVADVMEGSVLQLCSMRTGLSPALPGAGGDDEE